MRDRFEKRKRKKTMLHLNELSYLMPKCDVLFKAENNPHYRVEFISKFTVKQLI